MVNVVTGGAKAGAALVANPHVARIDLTGGTATGKRVAAAAAERLVPCTLELGGKTPVLIFDDAKLDEAVAGALFSGFVAAGQTCVSGSRFLVQQSIYPEFLARLADRVANLRIGDPADEATDLGPVISAASRDRCMRFIEIARAEGARLLCGGEPLVMQGRLDSGFTCRPPSLPMLLRRANSFERRFSALSCLSHRSKMRVKQSRSPTIRNLRWVLRSGRVTCFVLTGLLASCGPGSRGSTIIIKRSSFHLGRLWRQWLRQGKWLGRIEKLYEQRKRRCPHA